MMAMLSAPPAALAAAISAAAWANAALHEAGLVDEYRLLVFPVCVGAGKRLFQGDGPGVGFEVAQTRTTPAGVTYLNLRPTEFQSGVVHIGDGKDTV